MDGNIDARRRHIRLFLGQREHTEIKQSGVVDWRELAR
jgi:hypothetical protein